MTTVDLVYDDDCPNVPAARASLSRALAIAGLSPAWTEHRIGDPAAPQHTRGYGSPTVLVDGRDVAGVGPSSEICCRIYSAETGIAGAPGVEQIATALAASQERTRPMGRDGDGRRVSLAMVPGIGVALLPNLACPACWPAYAGALTSLGLGFLLDTRWLWPLTALSLCVAVGALAFRAGRRRGFGPFFAGLAGAILVLAGKFQLENDTALYAGLVLLIGASIWNTWPAGNARACPI